MSRRYPYKSPEDLYREDDPLPWPGLYEGEVAKMLGVGRAVLQQQKDLPIRTTFRRSDKGYGRPITIYNREDTEALAETLTRQPSTQG